MRQILTFAYFISIVSKEYYRCKTDSADNHFTFSGNIPFYEIKAESVLEKNSQTYCFNMLSLITRDSLYLFILSFTIN